MLLILTNLTKSATNHRREFKMSKATNNKSLFFHN
jgi:hypothetical protein